MDRLNAATSSALRREGDLDALACVDLRTGAVLSAALRDARSRDALEVAAQVASQLCGAQAFELGAGGDAPVREAFVVSDRAVHVFVPSALHARRVWVGVAPGNANLGLVLSALRTVAGTLDVEAP